MSSPRPATAPPNKAACAHRCCLRSRHPWYMLSSTEAITKPDGLLRFCEADQQSGRTWVKWAKLQVLYTYRQGAAPTTAEPRGTRKSAMQHLEKDQAFIHDLKALR
eukprot:6203333-Pleurochrysis_carterae.AAC.3